ncbi:MAG: hypothetical protein QW371_02005 [Candidatus Bathyarchaeia archaeon]
MITYDEIRRYIEMTAYWPLEFWQQFENDWLTYRVIPAAKRNPVYEDVENIRDIEDLEDYPAIDWKDIERKADEVGGLEKLITAEPVAFWKSSGTSGRQKIIWASEEDLDMLRRMIGRVMYNFGLGPETRALILGAPMGYVSMTVPMLTLNWIKEAVGVPFTELGENRHKVFDNGRFDILFTLPYVAHLLALRDEKKRLLKKYGKIPLLSNLILFIAQKKVERAFKNCQLYMSGDFRTDFQDELFTEFFGKPSCMIYASTEVVGGGGECFLEGERFHKDKMHPAFDNYVPLIIPLEEMEKERRDPDYEPKKRLLWNVPDGTIGEAVFTANSDCFVRINYRTGDVIKKVQDPRDCPKGLPAFEMMGRALRKVDEPELGLDGYEATMVKVAAAPFCVKYVFGALSRVRENGRIRDWFMTLRYKSGKPEVVLYIEAEYLRGKGALEAEILKAMRESIELEPFFIVTDMGMAEFRIEHLQRNTMEAVRNQKIKAFRAGDIPLGRLKIPKLVIDQNYFRTQGLF